ncbi:MAG TPA: 3-hydroxyacyl-CoA dehydrogenase family protein, partial [Acidimicrobiales bacterium]|nr:3-hydroxyacyl-CoA dehydrogenase family protein [Acidimicrobiales bacterium]
GGGTMGAGIAEVFLRAGRRVVLCETTEEAAEAARARVVGGLRGTEPAGDAGAPAALLQVVVGIPDQPAEVAIEAVFENSALKRSVLAEVEARVPDDALLASNTSSLSIGDLARSLTRPERFLGMHFFNPVPRSSLVELVTGPATAPQAVERARQLVRLLDKEEIVVRDSPGFATSRLGVAIGLEAVRMLEEGVASAEDIDRGMVLGYRFPMGPLRLTDLVGLDVRLAIAEHLERQLGERFAPPRLLREKVAAGELGKKTGQGFFTW